VKSHKSQSTGDTENAYARQHHSYNPTAVLASQRQVHPKPQLSTLLQMFPLSARYMETPLLDPCGDKWKSLIGPDMIECSPMRALIPCVCVE
jgi:hypothetical protein